MSAFDPKRTFSNLFVGDGSARRPGQRNDLKVVKAGLATPAGEVRTRVVESITEFDQHVERHEQAKCIIAAGSSMSASITTNAPPWGSAS